LEQEAHRQKLLRSKMHQTLALVRGTIRLLQGVVAAAMIFVLLSPTWRDFFLQDIPHRTLLTVLLSGAVLASLYFEVEVYQLGSGEAF
jgi:CHASE1-domain containing sensor protein